jgi:hypothetical protein
MCTLVVQARTVLPCVRATLSLHDNDEFTTERQLSLCESVQSSNEGHRQVVSVQHLCFLGLAHLCIYPPEARLLEQLLFEYVWM